MAAAPRAVEKAAAAAAAEAGCPVARKRRLQWARQQWRCSVAATRLKLRRSCGRN